MAVSPQLDKAQKRLGAFDDLVPSDNGQSKIGAFDDLVPEDVPFKGLITAKKLIAKYPKEVAAYDKRKAKEQQAKEQEDTSGVFGAVNRGLSELGKRGLLSGLMPASSPGDQIEKVKQLGGAITGVVGDAGKAAALSGTLPGRIISSAADRPNASPAAQRAKEVAGKIGEFAAYAVPGVGQVGMAGQAMQIGPSLIQDPSGTVKQLAEGMNPAAANLPVEDRILRTLALAGIAVGAGAKAGKAAYKLTPKGKLQAAIEAVNSSSVAPEKIDALFAKDPDASKLIVAQTRMPVSTEFKGSVKAGKRVLTPEEYQAKYAQPTQALPEPQKLEGGKPNEIQGIEEGQGRQEGLLAQPERTYAAKNASTEVQRAGFNLDALPEPQRKPMETMLANAKEKGLNRTITAHAEDLIAGKRGAFTDEEVAGSVVRLAELDNKYRPLKDQYDAALERGSTKEADLLEPQLQGLQNEFNTLTKALKKTGTETARALVSRKMQIGEDYSYLGTKSRLEERVGKLTTKEDAQLKMVSDAVEKATEDLRKRLDDLESAQFKKDAEAFLKSSTKKKFGTRTREEIRADRAKANDLFIQSMVGTANVGIPINAAKAVAKIAATYVEEGVLTLSELYAKVKADIAPHYDLSEQEFHEALGGMIKEDIPRATTRTEAQKELARLRAEAKRIAKEKSGKASSEIDARVLDVNAKIAEYERQIKANEFPPSETKQPRQEPEDVQMARERLYTAQKKARLLQREIEEARAWKDAPQIKKAASMALDLTNLPRTLKATLDLSATLRQGAVLTASHPVIGAKAFWKQIKAAFGKPEVFEQYEAQWNTRQNALNGAYRKGGLHLSDVGNLSKREEAFASKLIGKAPVIAHAERGYVTYLNEMRTQVFDLMAEQAGGSKNLSKEQLRDIGRFINVATGRGDGDFANALSKLNGISFAPRFAYSRGQLALMQPAFKASSGATRGLVVKEYARAFTAGATVMALAKLSGADINFDPRTNDFGRIKVGNTVYDIWAGATQPMRLFVQMFFGVAKSPGGKANTSDFARAQEIYKYLKYKQSHMVSIVSSIWSGKGFDGKRISYGSDVMNQDNIWNIALMPLPINDFAESIEKNGPVSGTAKALPSILGVGTQTR